MLQVRLPNKKWLWIGEWHIADEPGDEEGWKYAKSFSSDDWTVPKRHSVCS